MKWSAEYSHALRYPLLRFGVAFVLAILAVAAALQYREEARESLRRQQDLHEQAHRDDEAREAEKHLLVRYLPVYKQLQVQGFIGQERRRQWLDALQSIQRQHGLFGIDYQVTPRQAYENDAQPANGAYRLYRSTLQLQLALLHEGDLLTLLDGLAGTAPYLLRECEIKRVAPTSVEDSLPQLQGECTLDWLTLQMARAGKGS